MRVRLLPKTFQLSRHPVYANSIRSERNTTQRGFELEEVLLIQVYTESRLGGLPSSSVGGFSNSVLVRALSNNVFVLTYASR